MCGGGRNEKIVFLANDPGGYQVIFPVYQEAGKSMDAAIFLSGAAGEKNPGMRKDKKEILSILSEMIKRKDEPFILVTGTSWNSDTELSAILLCKQNGIPTVSILDYWSNYKRRFRLQDQYVFPDHLFVMDKLAYREAEQDGIDESLMQIVGHPGLDAYLNITIEQNRSRKLLFLSQPLSVIYGSSVRYTEYDIFKDIIAAGREFRYDVNVKFHPKEAEEFMETFRAYSVEGVLEELVSQYEAVIGMGTIGLLQCALMGMPVISYQPGLTGEDDCITNKLGITRGAFSFEELRERMKNIRNFSWTGAAPDWLDGKSAQRCMEAIQKLCL